MFAHEQVVRLSMITDHLPKEGNSQSNEVQGSIFAAFQVSAKGRHTATAGGKIINQYINKKQKTHS